MQMMYRDKVVQLESKRVPRMDVASELFLVFPNTASRSKYGIHTYDIGLAHSNITPDFPTGGDVPLHPLNSRDFPLLLKFDPAFDSRAVPSSSSSASKGFAMVTGKSQPGLEQVPFPASPDPVGATSPPSKRDLASWWRQFKRNSRKDELKGIWDFSSHELSASAAPARSEPARGIFGVPLNESIKYANVAISLTNEQGENFIYGYVPIVVAKCGVFLKEKATDVEGIFRLNGSAKRIKDLQELFDSPERYGKGLDWDGYTVHDAANVLRRYLNQLPEPIVPLEFYERFREPLRAYQQQVKEEKELPDADKFDHPKAVETYQRLIVELPPLNKQLLLYILDLLAVFASKSEQNRMTSANLSAIFQPGMLSHPQHDMSPEEYKLSQDVLIFLIENQDHFLVGMNGTKADEQTIKEVQAGIPPKIITPQGQPTGAKSPSSTIRRSASSASASAESHRKLDNLRRNASVSSRNSRTSNTGPSPGTPNSVSGSVHRSNTLPSKMGPVVTSARYPRAAETNTANPVHPSNLSVSHSSSRSGSRPPSGRYLPAYRSSRNILPLAIPGGYPYARAETIQSLCEISTTGEQKETRQPKRLQKKRIPGSASMSAQSSSNSLHNPAYEPPPAFPSEMKQERRSVDIPVVGDATPKPPNTATLSHEGPAALQPGSGDTAHQNHTETSLRPSQSRTPSMNSRSSFTDNSDADQPEDASRDYRDNRRSWRFHRSVKRSSEQSTSSIGSGLQKNLDFTSQSLNVDPSGRGSSVSSAEPEKKSLFGKFKAKVAQVRDGARDDRDRVKSPNSAENDPSSAPQPLSPTTDKQADAQPTIEIPSEGTKEEPVRSPTSPLPGAGMPPSIPEEPHSPEVAALAPSTEVAAQDSKETPEPASAQPAESNPSDAPKGTASNEVPEATEDTKDPVNNVIA
ncbi:hypothetical protein N7468_000811 [Penicillium chermesinum]|uniref:Rho-GAP domain-containing protein n=1 Tax=Penicillium chermesinum TaxID=63820 RepID=A0A9W9TWS4_9EURO|nr:uncharacterized protein N7468_000811 [Penicillium chermesinum]KAJ5245828.1 hypothetical protein N7468_000811 [Penicillium chermesinum]